MSSESTTQSSSIAEEKKRAFYAVIGNKPELYNVVILNQYYVPKFEKTTVNYLRSVLNEKVWSLKYDQVRLKPCPRKPPKNELVEAVKNAIVQQNGVTDVGIDLAKQDTEYLLIILSSLNPEHSFFERDYAPPSKGNVPIFKFKNISQHADSYLQGMRPSTNVGRRTVQYVEEEETVKLRQLQKVQKEIEIATKKMEKLKLESSSIISQNSAKIELSNPSQHPTPQTPQPTYGCSATSSISGNMIPIMQITSNHSVGAV